MSGRDMVTALYPPPESPEAIESARSFLQAQLDRLQKPKRTVRPRGAPKKSPWAKYRIGLLAIGNRLRHPQLSAEQADTKFLRQNKALLTELAIVIGHKPDASRRSMYLTLRNAYRFGKTEVRAHRRRMWRITDGRLSVIETYLHAAGVEALKMGMDH